MILTDKLPASYDAPGGNLVVDPLVENLIRSYGGRMFLYRNLPAEAQMALAQYMAVDGEAWERSPALEAEIGRRAGLKVQDDALTAAWERACLESLPFYVERYGDWDFGYVELPKDALVQVVMAGNADLVNDYDGDWFSYHAWYDGNGYKHTANGEKLWPVVLSSFTGEILEDGWNRFHQYVKRNLPVIPAVWFPAIQAGKANDCLQN